MHDFEAANSDELELKRGDVVLVVPTESTEDQVRIQQVTYVNSCKLLSYNILYDNNSNNNNSNINNNNNINKNNNNGNNNMNKNNNSNNNKIYIKIITVVIKIVTIITTI